VISGEIIKRARLRAGLTQKELAAQASKAPSVVGRWERGEVKPPLETVLELVRACGLDLSLEVIRPPGVDVAQIHETLSMTPEQRLASVQALANLILEGRQRVRDRVPA
jgi:hypothetical protein